MLLVGAELTAGEERENVGGAVWGRKGWLTAGAPQVVPERAGVLDDGVNLVTVTGHHAVG